MQKVLFFKLSLQRIKMVTSIYIDHLEAYHKSLENWLQYHRNGRCYHKNKGIYMNAAQKADDVASHKYMSRVVNELLTVERELETLKISKSILFKS